MEESDDMDALMERGVLRTFLPAAFDCNYWADKLSQVTPMIMFGQAEADSAFYRNIMEEEGFPFDMLLRHFTPLLCEHFGAAFMGENDNTTIDVKLDDAFCVHYNMTQQDTTGSKHTDPSDITVNICLRASEDIKGSFVQFYGSQSLCSVVKSDVALALDDNDKKDNDNTFSVKQRSGTATLHWGHHAHETSALEAGERTNIILVYCFRDPNKSQGPKRSCYFPK